jgi:prepilin-type N-terminal cleavage/methylation domain-containing protein/prepilin-type processing-associated H-X9-DG protein
MKREGFTLIELLMVLVIIALMIALLIPALQIPRRQTKAIKCGLNLKQLFLGLTMYHDDNGTFPNALNNTKYARQNPPPGSHAGYLNQDIPGWWWFNYITDYSRKDFEQKKVIWCPSRKVTRKLKRNVLCANYGVNQSICKSTGGERIQTEFVGAPLDRSQILRHSETMLIVDSGYSMINWWHATNIPPVPLGSSIEDAAYIPGLKINEEKKKWPGLEWDAVNGRHPNKTVNVVFVDSHAERREAEDLYVEKTQEGYRNCHPLWQPNKNCD